MATMVRDVVTKNPVSCETTTTVDEAARMMRDHDIGDLVVCYGQQLRCIVTDRGIVVGVVSLGDLGAEVDPHPVLADISAAEPNV